MFIRFAILSSVQSGSFANCEDVGVSELENTQRTTAKEKCRKLLKKVREKLI